MRRRRPYRDTIAERAGISNLGPALNLVSNRRAWLSTGRSTSADKPPKRMKVT